MKKTAEEIRQSNLRYLLDNRFEGDIVKLAEVIHRGVGTIRKYLSPRRERSINSATARVIERSLALDTGYLDSEYHGKLTIYYVTLKVSRNFTYSVVERIQAYSEAVECSAILGEFDVLIKVEAATYHELQVFYDKLSRLPGVQRTKTYPAVGSIRWQRQQSANQSLQNPNSFTHYADEYKHHRILECLEEIRKLEAGNILSDDSQLNRVDLNALMLTVRTEFNAIRLHDEAYDNEAEYLAAERERIADGMISKRIITLPKNFTSNPMNQSKYDALLETAKGLIAIGSQIRFIFVEEWITNNNHIPECFAVVDKQFVYVKENEKRSRLLTLHEDLKRYKHAFKVNWGRSMSLEDLMAYNGVSH
ncbi:MAG: Lrp/AsnC ligand binding domain-containing protein [Leucothrix sp.]